MKIENNRVVSLHYTLTDDEGNQLDSSAGRDPLVYLHGTSGIIPGLETALTGKAAGDELQVTVPPENGYGPIRPELVQTLPRSAFEGVDEIESGMRFRAQDPSGQSQVIAVREVNDDGVTVDANHPLAGQVLHFDLKVEAVREATEEEVSHGHPH